MAWSLFVLAKPAQGSLIRFMAEENDNQLIELQKSQRFDSMNESLQNLSSSTVKVNAAPKLYTSAASPQATANQTAEGTGSKKT